MARTQPTRGTAPAMGARTGAVAGDLNNRGRPTGSARKAYDAMLARQVAEATARALNGPRPRLTLSPECRDGNHPACDPSWQTCECPECHQ